MQIVAVTGLPKPQANHAVLMVKFASKAMDKMADLVKSEDLIARLGPDTSELNMRVGLNSGAVTAGVLRGEKARFQLFGDTVNTASRMESNGERGRIHIAQSTADLLIASNKGHWLKPREDLVQAKGKGQMQCYWVDLGSMDSDSITMISLQDVTDDESRDGSWLHQD